MAVDQLKLQVVLGMVDKASGVLKGLKKNTTDVAEKYREAKKQLHEMNDAQRLVADARDLQTALTETGSKTILLKTQIKQLQDQTHLTGEAADKQRKQLKKLQDQQEANTRVSDAQKQRAKSLREALDKLGVGNLAQAEGELAQKIKASTAALEAQKIQLDQVMQRERKLATLKAAHAKSMQKWGIHAGAGVAAAASGQAVASTGMVPVKAYAAAEDAAVGLKVAMMGAGGAVPPAYEKIKQLAEQLGNKLPGTTADFQNMMTMLVRQGMSAEKILGGVGQASAYMAVQLKKTPEAAAEFASKMQDATRTTDTDMMGLMDTIQRAFYLGVDDNAMLQGFSKLSPALSILRKEGLGAAKDLAPLLVMADQAGMAGEAAGNAYRKIFQAAMGSKKIDKANAALAGTGVKLNFTNGKGEFGGMEQLFAQLQQLKGVNTQKRLEALKEAFGDDAETLQALTLMIEKGQNGYNEIASRMQTQADLQTRVNEQLGTLKNLWDAASGTFTNTMATFGEAMAPEIKALTEWFGKASEKVGAFAKENPGLTKAIGLTVLGIGGLLVVGGTLLTVFSAFALKAALVRFALGRLGLAMASTATKAPLLYRMGHWLGRAWGLASQAAGWFARGLGMLVPVIKFVASSFMWLCRIFLMNPIGLAITAIAAGAYFVYTNWAWLKAGFSEIWTTIARGASIVWTSITGTLSSLPQKFMTIGGQIMDGLMGGLAQRWESTKAWFANLGTSIAQTARNALGIKSPSRVFAEIGGHVMGGLSVGLAKGEADPLALTRDMADKMTQAGATLALPEPTWPSPGAAPKLQSDAMRKQLAGLAVSLTLGTAGIGMPAMAQDLPGVPTDTRTPPLINTAPSPLITPREPAHGQGRAGGGGGGAASTGPIQITIHAAPGMDPQAIAKAVAAELDRRDRAGKSRVRSAMQDID